MNIVFFTGAGISKAAGIATYRDGNSSWVDPDLERMSHADRYGNHLQELWEKHWWPTACAMMNAQPTRAHQLINRLERDHDVFVFTQNIDGLHEKAGSTEVVDFHGTMDVRCMKCSTVQPFHGNLIFCKSVPMCHSCGSFKVRPDVVLFGETPSAKKFKKAQSKIAKADFMVCIGSSLIVTPAANLIIDALGTNTKIININPKHHAMAKWFEKEYVMDANTGVKKFIRDYL